MALRASAVGRHSGVMLTLVGAPADTLRTAGIVARLSAGVAVVGAGWAFLAERLHPPEAIRGPARRRDTSQRPGARRRLRVAAGLVLLVLVVTACTAGPVTGVGHGMHDAGLWLGLWQGFIAPIAFVVSLLNHSVGIYEAHNNGGWYNFGFLVGVSIIFSGAGAGARASSRPSRRSR